MAAVQTSLEVMLGDLAEAKLRGRTVWFSFSSHGVLFHGFGLLKSVSEVSIIGETAGAAWILLWGLCNPTTIERCQDGEPESKYLPAGVVVGDHWWRAVADGPTVLMIGEMGGEAVN